MDMFQARHILFSPTFNQIKQILILKLKEYNETFSENWELAELTSPKELHKDFVKHYEIYNIDKSFDVLVDKDKSIHFVDFMVKVCSTVNWSDEKQDFFSEISNEPLENVITNFLKNA